MRKILISSVLILTMSIGVLSVNAETYTDDVPGQTETYINDSINTNSNTETYVNDIPNRETYVNEIPKSQSDSGCYFCTTRITKYFYPDTNYSENDYYPNYFAPDYARYDYGYTSIPYYYVPSYNNYGYYPVPSYSVNTNYSVPSYNVPNVNINTQAYNVPSFTVPSTNINYNTGNIKAIDSVKKYEISPTTVNYYPGGDIQTGVNYINAWTKNNQYKPNNYTGNDVYGSGVLSGDTPTKEWLLRNGKHTAITKVALANGAGSFIMQGACIDGCAPGVGGYFEWGTNPNNLAARTDLVSAGGNMVNNFSQKLTGLKSGVTYYYRSVIQDRNGNKRVGQLMSYTVPYFKNIVSTAKGNIVNTGNTKNISIKGNVNAESGAIITQNGANTIIVMPDGRVITVDANGKSTTVNGNIPTCNCANDLTNQNNINTTNSNISNTNTASNTQSFWSSLFGKATATVATSSNMQNIANNTINTKTDTIVNTGYSWYEWLVLFVLLFVFIGAIRYLLKAFGKSSSAMH